MAIVRIEALQILADAIGCRIPALANAICVGQATAEHDLAFPSLVIKPKGKWVYSPHQALETFTPSPSTVVVNVGHHQATVELKIGHKTPYQRYELEQAVLDLFLETPMRPGVLLTTVLACKNKLGEFLASWMLEDDSWEDEFAFDTQFYSTISVVAIIPALVTRGSAYTIQQLQVGLTEDLETEFDSSTFNSSSDVEVVQVNQDGTIQAVP